MTLQKKIDNEFMGTFGREFWAILRWETGPNQRNFFNWLKTHSKVAKAQNKHVIHHFGGMLPLKSVLQHFGGMLVLKSGLRFFISAPKVPFFANKKN